MSISQQEYDYLMALDKVFDDPSELLSLGPPPLDWSRPINAPATKDKFLLDFYRGSFELTKYTFNKRYRQTVILLRYDSLGRHTNPDGVTFDGPHLHLYREGYNDKFAFQVEHIGISEADDRADVLKKILWYCNVQPIPVIDKGLF